MFEGAIIKKETHSIFVNSKIIIDHVSDHLFDSLFPPANPTFPVSDDFEPSGEQIRHDRPAGLHRLLLHHPQGEAQRDHAAQHRAEPRRLLQLDAQASKQEGSRK